MRRCCIFAVLAIIVSSYQPAAAFVSDARTRAAEIDQTVKEVHALYKAKKIDEAEQLLAKAKESLEELASSSAKDELADTLKLLQRKIAASQKLITNAKTSAARPAAGKSKPTPKTKPKAKTTKSEPKSDEISFTKQVAPLLVARCGNCHIRNTKGGLSMASYAALKNGSTEGGTVFTPGKGQGSRLIDVLQSGDMPRGGGPLKSEEISLIAKWIDAGAKFDGQDENAPIVASASTGNQPQQPALQAMQASGKESVQFVRDLAPIVVSTCVECHGGMQPRAGLNLTTFAGLLRGGDNGPIVSPGKPAESTLIKKLKGTAGARMPLNKEPLDDATIKKFETWVAEGAKLDWPDPNELLDWAVRVMVASKMNHEELSDKRADLAEKNWRLGSPDIKPEKAENEQFLLLGNLSPARMVEVTELVKQARGKVAKAFNLKPNEPFFKGRMTIFAFKRHFDYTEFGTMVERRELPTELHGHWRYNVVDCYGCVLVPDDDKGVELTLAEIFAGSYIENQGKIPRWFSEGAARAIAARLFTRDPAAKHWDEEVKEALAAGKSADDFLKSGEVLSEESAALSYGFMKELIGRPTRLMAMLADVREGTSFEAAFRQNFGGEPAALAAGWLQRAMYSRRK